MSLASHLQSNKVVIFAWSHCPYCKKAKALFESITKDMSYVIIDGSAEGEAIHQEIIKSTGHETVPAVYINGKLIGGFSDCDALNNEGKLLPLLA
eukprot:CAMPEP_0176444860 /NCGR_PEP_ID=MMETSP0127-20121128/23324_1 /TAXON_ID=938130 /ORGANISM="Platyophrya macrostoma, Strain WH" /LENGTH=94 /DNA_ID=CAMNT_0017830469 /DNA_START=41 /DNA_END=325 /DNA_ORIENTATION=+